MTQWGTNAPSWSDRLGALAVLPIAVAAGWITWVKLWPRPKPLQIQYDRSWGVDTSDNDSIWFFDLSVTNPEGNPAISVKRLRLLIEGDNYRQTLERWPDIYVQRIAQGRTAAWQPLALNLFLQPGEDRQGIVVFGREGKYDANIVLSERLTLLTELSVGMQPPLLIKTL